MGHLSTTILVSGAFVFLSLLSCQKKSDPASLAAHPTAKAQACANDGPHGAKPGSYEDWCAGHQVPESLCTRCNPSLIAAFKATGDWCGEHGLPESQCLVCNPNLKIERPPRTGRTDP